MFNLFDFATESQIAILHTDDTGMKVTENKQQVIPVIVPEFEPKDLSLVNKKDTNKQTNDETVLEISGPLSEVYTKALNVVFDKENKMTIRSNPDTTGMESQANDAIMQGKLFSYLSNTNNQDKTKVFITPLVDIEDEEEFVNNVLDKAYDVIVIDAANTGYYLDIKKHYKTIYPLENTFKKFDSIKSTLSKKIPNTQIFSTLENLVEYIKKG